MMRPQVVLDGVSLSGLSDSIIIVDISEKSPTQKLTTSERYAQDGLSVLSNRRQSIEISVEIEIRNASPSMRQSVMTDIRKWCMGSVLEISNRPQQRIRVECTGIPAINSMMHHMEHLTITFVSYECPYWEDASSTACTGSSANILGTADTQLNCVVTVTKSIKSLTLTLGNGCSVSFNNLTTVKNDVIMIDHDAHGRMTAVLKHTGGTTESIYNHLTISSYDDLVVSPGAVDLSMTVTYGTATVAWSYRARWC